MGTLGGERGCEGSEARWKWTLEMVEWVTERVTGEGNWTEAERAELQESLRAVARDRDAARGLGSFDSLDERNRFHLSFRQATFLRGSEAAASDAAAKACLRAQWRRVLRELSSRLRAAHPTKLPVKLPAARPSPARTAGRTESSEGLAGEHEEGWAEGQLREALTVALVREALGNLAQERPPEAPWSLRVRPSEEAELGAHAQRGRDRLKNSHPPTKSILKTPSPSTTLPPSSHPNSLPIACPVKLSVSHSSPDPAKSA